MMKTHRVDLMALDMIMDPGIDGPETVKRILKNQSRQSAIITSGFPEKDHVREAQNLGDGAYIKKAFPFFRHHALMNLLRFSMATSEHIS